MRHHIESGELVGAIVEEVLLHGLDDWVQAADIVGLIVEAGVPCRSDGIWPLYRSVISVVLSEGLMDIGDVSEDGFKSWKLDSDAALSKLDTEWARLDGLPDLGEVCWLSNTEAGDAQANQTKTT